MVNHGSWSFSPLSPRQPFLYVLAKTHKNKSPMPLRHILSATGCYNFNLAKFICKLIRPFCYSKYCLNNVDEFLTRLKVFKENLLVGASIKQCSYDVESHNTRASFKVSLEKTTPSNS